MAREEELAFSFQIFTVVVYDPIGSRPGPRSCVLPGTEYFVDCRSCVLPDPVHSVKVPARVLPGNRGKKYKHGHGRDPGRDPIGSYTTTVKK